MPSGDRACSRRHSGGDGGDESLRGHVGDDLDAGRLRHRRRQSRPGAHFAKALLKRAKTDARTLAQLAATLQPTPWPPPPAVYTEIQQRLLRRDALAGMRQQARNQRHALVQLPTVVAAVKERLDVLIATLDAHIKATEAELTEVIRQDSYWAANAELLLSSTGIGLLTAAWLLVATVNFELCPTVEAATTYVGLAPYPRESGTSVRGRHWEHLAVGARRFCGRSSLPGTGTGYPVPGRPLLA